jgi:lipoate-protein ligase A
LSFDQRGYSDIVIHDKKCVGTSLFRSRNYLLYQASLLIDLDVAAIERYLAHPSAEPDYRKGRRHRDFLCGLREHTPLSPQQWREIFVRELEPHLEETLRHDLIDPRVDQMPHLHSRMGEMHPLG